MRKSIVDESHFRYRSANSQRTLLIDICHGVVWREDKFKIVDALINKAKIDSLQVELALIRRPINYALVLFVIVGISNYI